MIRSTLAIVFALSASTTIAHPEHTTYSQLNPLVISCDRGHTMEYIIEDTATSRMIDSIVQRGIDYATASHIAEQICTTRRYVGNLSAAEPELRRLIQQYQQ